MGIQQLTVQQKRLSSAEAELWVLVRFETNDESAQLRGSLVGPKCPGIESVQINYPLLPIAPAGLDRNVLMGRIVIPEPNFWTEQQPFVYDGQVELWQGERCLERQAIRASFKAPAARKARVD